jgi:hypothetical protein
MQSLQQIIYQITTNETNLKEAKDYIFRQSSFKQQTFENFVNQLENIQSSQAQELLQTLIENEHQITITDQMDEETPTHIEALQTTRVAKSPSFTSASILQQRMDSDSQSTITDNQLGQQQHQQLHINQQTPPNIITPLTSQSQQSQQSNRRGNFLPLQNDNIPPNIRNDMPGIHLPRCFKLRYKQQSIVNQQLINRSHLT